MSQKVGVGVGIILVKDGKVLLGKRHDDPEKADSEMHGEGTWTCPGGGVEFLESPEETAIREVEEETGIKVNKARVISMSNDRVEDAHFITIGLLAEDFEGEPLVKEPDEITEWKWFDLNELPSPLFLCSEKLIKNYLEKKFYSD